MNERQTTQLHTLILAAGSSRRLGQPKQLLRYRGSTLLSRSLTLANQVTPGRVSVVLGAHRYRCQGLAQRHRPKVTSIYNPDWRLGMGQSLSKGLQQLSAGRAQGVLILLCDQPNVTDEDLGRLKDIWLRRPQRAAAAHYEGRLGVPAIIPKRYWRHFLQLETDRGAGPWLNSQGPQVSRVAMPNAAFDVDTPAQLARL